MKTHTEAQNIAIINTFDRVNRIYADVAAIKEAVRLLLGASGCLPKEITPEQYMKMHTDHYLEETQPLIDQLRALMTP